MSLIGITRVLNEDDIVEAFVRHHAAMVDHHVFMDNGSSDETIAILRALKDEGLNISVFQNRSAFFAESSHNTVLFRHAANVLRAERRKGCARRWVRFRPRRCASGCPT
jgi:hypothetical protein